MINKLSQYFVGKMLSSGTISENDRELYVYGLFMLLSRIMFFIIACIFGLILSSTLESIIFYIAFQSIRIYAGGYHASTETKCDIMSTLSILACIVVIRLSKSYDLQSVLFFTGLAASIPIFLFCPLDTPEKPLTNIEFKYFRKISLIILFVIIALSTVSYFLGLNFLTAPCAVSLILEGLLLIAGKFKKETEKRQA